MGNNSFARRWYWSYRALTIAWVTLVVSAIAAAALHPENLTPFYFAGLAVAAIDAILSTNSCAQWRQKIRKEEG